MVTSRLPILVQSLIGLWLGLWTIAGVATFVSGLLILALQLYGYFCLDFWADLTPDGILQGFNIAYPVMDWKPAQTAIDCLLRLPLAGVFIWCGFHLAAMAWIARNNIERAAKQQTIIVPATGDRFAELGVSQLEITSKR